MAPIFERAYFWCLLNGSFSGEFIDRGPKPGYDFFLRHLHRCLRRPWWTRGHGGLCELMSTSEWGLFDRQFGRTDVEAADPEGRVPSWEESSVAEMKRKFSDVGLGPRQLAVMSAFLSSDQAAMEAKLASDPEVAPWVDKYQRSRETISETDYEVDLITTFTKIACLGQNINYEAYTYPRQRIDFTKLKL